MDDKKKGSQDTNTTAKKSDRTEFADDLNMDNKSSKSNNNR